jgi:hypothetical protein
MDISFMDCYSRRPERNRFSTSPDEVAELIGYIDPGVKTADQAMLKPER